MLVLSKPKATTDLQSDKSRCGQAAVTWLSTVGFGPIRAESRMAVRADGLGVRVARLASLSTIPGSALLSWRRFAPGRQAQDDRHRQNATFSADP
jgi:hypothetical protein